MVSPHAGDFKFQKSYENEAHEAKVKSRQKHQNMQFGATVWNLKSFTKDQIWYFCGISFYFTPYCP